MHGVVVSFKQGGEMPLVWPQQLREFTMQVQLNHIATMRRQMQWVWPCLYKIW